MIYCYLQTLDVLLQILVIFPKVETLRSKVWLKFFCFFVVLFLLVYAWLSLLSPSGYFIYSPNGGDIRIICISLPSKGIGAVACWKWGINHALDYNLIRYFYIPTIRTPKYVAFVAHPVFVFLLIEMQFYSILSPLHLWWQCPGKICSCIFYVWGC